MVLLVLVCAALLVVMAGAVLAALATAVEVLPPRGSDGRKQRRRDRDDAVALLAAPSHPGDGSPEGKA